MKISRSFAIMLLSLAATSISHAESPQTSPSLAIPRDAQRVVERHLTCLELIRDPRESGSEKDRYIEHELARLHCERSRTNLLKLKAKYRMNPEVLRVLRDAESGGAT